MEDWLGVILDRDVSVLGEGSWMENIGAAFFLASRDAPSLNVTEGRGGRKGMLEVAEVLLLLKNVLLVLWLCCVVEVCVSGMER